MEILLVLLAIAPLLYFVRSQYRKWQEASQRKKISAEKQRLVSEGVVPFLNACIYLLRQFQPSELPPQWQEWLIEARRALSTDIRLLVERVSTPPEWLTDDTPPEEIIYRFHFTPIYFAPLSLPEITALFHSSQKLFGMHPSIAAQGDSSSWREGLHEVEAAIQQAIREELLLRQGLTVLGDPLPSPGLPPELLSSFDPQRLVTLSPAQRARHCYMVGRPEFSRLNLLVNLIAPELVYQTEDRSIIVLSPNNALFERLFPYIPPKRANKLVYFTLTDIQDPVIGINPFVVEEGEDLSQKTELLSTLLIQTLHLPDETMRTLIYNAVSGLLQYPEATLHDLGRLLNPHHDDFRREITHSCVVDDHTRAFWRAYPERHDIHHASLILYNHFASLLTPPLVTVLSMTSFSFSKVLYTKPHVLFFNLAPLEGMQIQVVGQLILTQILRYLKMRSTREASPVTWSLYLDEFQAYISETTLFELFTLGDETHALNLVLSQQTSQALAPSLRAQIMNRVGTLIAGSLSPEEAVIFAQKFQLIDDKGFPNAGLLQHLDSDQAVVGIPEQHSGIRIRIPQHLVMPPYLTVPRDQYILALKKTAKLTFGKTREAGRISKTQGIEE